MEIEKSLHVHPTIARKRSSKSVSRKLLRSSLALVIALVSLTATAVANAAVAEAIAAGAAVGSTIEQLQSAAASILQQLEASVGISQFRIRQSMLIVQDELAYKLKELQGKTFADLNEPQKRFFLGIESAINEASLASKAPLESMQDIAKTVDGAVARLPFSDRSPRVRSIVPSYAVQAIPEQPLLLKVSGGELNHGEARLRFAGGTCTHGARTDNELQFSCKVNVAPQAASITPFLGELEIPFPQSFWKSLFNSPKRYKQYRLMIQAVPPQMGTYNVAVTRNTSSIETVERAGRVDAGNDHCEGGRRHGPFIFTVLGGPEFTIVPGSIRLGAEISGNQQRSVIGPLEVTNKGFVYYVDLHNGGSCVKVGGTVISKDARAHLIQAVHWSEQRSVTQAVTSEVGSGPLFWGRDVAISLGSAVTAWRVVVKQVDGSESVVIGQDNSRKWFRVDTDGAGQNIVIRPRSVDAALQ